VFLLLGFWSSIICQFFFFLTKIIWKACSSVHICHPLLPTAVVHGAQWNCLPGVCLACVCYCCRNEITVAIKLEKWTCMWLFSRILEFELKCINSVTTEINKNISKHGKSFVNVLYFLLSSENGLTFWGEVHASVNTWQGLVAAAEPVSAFTAHWAMSYSFSNCRRFSNK
jgi:hypothetical protein